MCAEFCEALQEMGTCLVKRVTPNKEGINGNHVVFFFFTLSGNANTLL
jgi:hypothetical protein